MYINFWYPVGRSEEITHEKPYHAKILRLPFVAFRDQDGKAHVLSDTCIHRGGSLSAGKINGNCIACPYHGWEFDGEGKCAKLPSLAGVKPPPRAKVDSHPVQEKYGIVFAFLGDLPEEERPPLYEIEEYGTPEWKTQTYVLNLKAYYERSMENGMDPIHNEFVHPLQGAPMLSPEKQREPVPMTDIAYGSKFYMAFGGKKDYNTDLAKDKQGERLGAAGSWHQGPNQLVTWIDITATNSFHQYLFEAPVDENSTRIFFINMRNWMIEDKFDQRIEDVTLKIVHEDIDVLERLNPVRTPESNSKELLVPGDYAVVRYREWLQQWEENGWRIDLKKLREAEGDVAYAIPSPARREQGNWVVDPVPLVPGKNAASQAKPERQAG